MLRFLIIGFLFNLTYTFDVKLSKRDSPVLFGSINIENRNSEINIPVDENKVSDNKHPQLDVHPESHNDNQKQVVGNIPKNPFAGDEHQVQENEKQDVEETNKDFNQNNQLSNVAKQKELDKNKQIFSKDTIKQTNSTNINDKSSTLIPFHFNKDDAIQSGALLRGFYVFLSLSILTMLYFIFRSCRLRLGSQPPSTVRKYGITARRNDMEMRPLELEEDDDDTLFEITSQNITNR